MSFSFADVPYYSSRDGDDDGASTDGSTGSGWSSSSKVGRAVSGGRRGQQGAFLLGREARAVRLWRAAVITSLVVGTVAITAAMWFLLSQQDESTYQAAYAVVTRTVEARATEQVLKLHEAMIALGEVFTATAIAENMTWPFVTVTREPFEVLGHDARRESGAEFTFVVPFVAEAQRKEWLQYSADNIGWYEQGKVVDEMLSSSSERRAYIEGNISQDFFTRLGPAPVLNGTTKHAPVWQSTPPPYIPGVVNYDIVHENYFENTIAEMEGARAPTGLFSDVFNLTGGSALAGSAEYHQRYHQAFSSSPVPVNETDARPHGIFIVPIFEAYQDTASKLVGVVGSLLAWDRYMVNLVPESVTGILVVLENSCNQSYSFVLNGTKAQYLGAGAFLNLTFPESRYSVSLDVSDRASRASGSSSESRDRTDFGNCVYSLQLYSTSEFKNSVATDTAFVFTLVAACVGTMVIATFLLYDCYVRRRNSKMVDAAARRDQLLTNLIPTTVRTRLLEEQDHAEKNCPSSGGVMVHHRLRNFLSGKDGKDEHEAAEKPVSGSIASEGYEGRPIADLYEASSTVVRSHEILSNSVCLTLAHTFLRFPEATILCADISGFTAWASVRQPSQVFTLLESIFKEFDTMANKRKVFKVRDFVALAYCCEERD
jgi:Adenylate and Guanylate cyclase catalytic domain